jgi:hypothetical protein
LMKTEVFANLDLRPYLQTASDSGWATHQNLSEHRAAGIDALLEQQQKSARETANDVTAGAGADPTQNIQRVQQFDAGTVGLSPGAKVAAVQQQVSYGQTYGQGTELEGTAQAAANAAFDPTGLTTAGTAAPPPTFPEEDIINIYGTGPDVLNNLIQEEINFNTQQKTPGAQQGGINVVPTRVGGGPLRGTQSGRQLSYLGARNHLFDMNQEEFNTTQEKLAMAGYFDKLGQAPVKGDVNDAVTQQAWELMLADTFRERLAGNPYSIQDVLTKRGATYRQTVIARNEQAMIKNWQGDVRYAADAMAIDQVGRRLNEGEFAQLQGFLQGLRKDRTNDILGVDDMTGRTDQQRAMGFDDTEVQRKVDELVGPERAAQTSYDMWQGANDYFGVSTTGNPQKDAGAPGGRTPIVPPPKPANAPSRTNV